MKVDGQHTPSRAGAWHTFFGRGSLGRYGLLGFSGTAVDLAVYAGLVLVGVIPVIATIVSSFLGIVTNYVANALFNFRVRPNRVQAIKFTAVGIVGLAAAAALLQLALVLGAGVWWSKLVSLVIVIPVQFLANRSWTFRT